MKRTYSFLIQTLMILSLFFAVGCGKDDSPNESEKTPVVDPNKPDKDSGKNPVIDPNTPVKDPVGTITANISESTHIQIPNFGAIWWTKPDNFYISAYSDYYLGSICNLGTMKGLGNITHIPQTGYTIPQNRNTTVACEEGHGYVIKFEYSDKITYIRLYVVESIVSTSGGIMGAKVKYQFPFEPTTLTVSKDKLSLTKEQGTQTITVTTDSPDWNYSCSDSWINATKSGNTLSVSVSANDGLVRKGSIAILSNEKRVDIAVKQDMATTSAPYAIGDLYYENGVSGVVYKITIGGSHGMIVSVQETESVWSTVYETTGCLDLSNGMNNMNTIKKIAGWENKYPAFKWCNDFNTGGVSG